MENIEKCIKLKLNGMKEIKFYKQLLGLKLLLKSKYQNSSKTAFKQLMFTFMAGVSEFERDLINQRTQDLIITNDGVKLIIDNTRDKFANLENRRKREYNIVDIFIENGNNRIYYRVKSDTGEEIPLISFKNIKDLRS